MYKNNNKLIKLNGGFMEKFKEILKEYKIYLIVIVLSVIIFNIKVPYYILAPGGIIPIDDRIETDNVNDSEGSINLLYVTQYDGNVSSLILSFFLKNWDIEILEKVRLSNETTEELHKRNQIMLDNSMQNAIFVAYKHAGKNIEITGKKNIIIGTTEDNELKINDEILSVNDIEVEDINTLKDVISKTEVGESIKLKIKRNGKELEFAIPVTLKNNMKVIGVVMITNYEYELDPKLKLNFKDSEGGSSGGVMMAVSIYNAITEDDITKGLNIGGTGTIDILGNVGEIDGVKYKIMGAVKNDLDLVFVPSANYEEAIDTKNANNYDIEIISIDTFDDVINYLENYEK